MSQDSKQRKPDISQDSQQRYILSDREINRPVTRQSAKTDRQSAVTETGYPAEVNMLLDRRQKKACFPGRNMLKAQSTIEDCCTRVGRNIQLLSEQTDFDFTVGQCVVSDENSAC